MYGAKKRAFSKDNSNNHIMHIFTPICPAAVHTKSLFDPICFAVLLPFFCLKKLNIKKKLKNIV